MTTKENLPLLHTGLIVWLDLPVRMLCSGIVWSPVASNLIRRAGVWPQADAIVKRLEEAGEVDKRPLLKQVGTPVPAVPGERWRGWTLNVLGWCLRQASDPVEALMKLYNERQKHYKLVSRPPPRDATRGHTGWPDTCGLAHRRTCVCKCGSRTRRCGC
jgi:hypothetical protein